MYIKQTYPLDKDSMHFEIVWAYKGCSILAKRKRIESFVHRSQHLLGFRGLP